jgi:hypothetical protein
VAPAARAFDYTGAPKQQTVIWESVLNWMQGNSPEALADTSADITTLLADLLDPPTAGVDYRTEEPKRLGAAR